MARWVLIAALAAMLAAGCSTASRPRRAIWIWEQPSYAMLRSPDVAAEALAYLWQEDIRTLYLYSDAFQGGNLILDDPRLYRAMIRRAHGEGMQVYALLGSWHLHTERYSLPQHHGRAVAMLQRVLEYNASSAPDERFDGVNYDIEPHLLDEWGDDTRERLLAGFLDMSARMMDAGRAAEQRIPIGPAMPFWWNGIPIDWRGRTKPMSEHVQDITDYVALMDYRNRADGSDGILAHAGDEMRYAEQIGRRVVIGLEMSPHELAKVTFDGIPRVQFEHELHAVTRHYGGSPAFGGFVLHHYDSYREWRSRGPGKD